MHTLNWLSLPVLLWLSLPAFFWLGSIITATVALYSYKKGGDGFLLGLLLGPFGMLIALIMRHTLVVRERREQFDDLQYAIKSIANQYKNQDENQENEGGTKNCPLCAEKVKAAAKVCKHCKQVIIKRPSSKKQAPAKAAT